MNRERFGKYSALLKRVKRLFYIFFGNLGRIARLFKKLRTWSVINGVRFRIVWSFDFPLFLGLVRRYWRNAEIKGASFYPGGESRRTRLPLDQEIINRRRQKTCCFPERRSIPFFFHFSPRNACFCSSPLVAFPAWV